jgi:hypothetical protein
MKVLLSISLSALVLTQVSCSSTQTLPGKPNPSGSQQKSKQKNSDSNSNGEQKQNTSPNEVSKPGNPTSTTPFDVTELLPTGNWNGPCLKEEGTVTNPLRASSNTTYQFVDDRLVRSVVYYDRDACGINGEATHVFTLNFKIELGTESTVVPQARVLVEKHEQTIVTPLTQAFVAAANANQFFDQVDWRVQSPKLILSNNSPRTDIFKIVDSKLCFGKFEKREQQLILVGLDTTQCLTPAKQ